MRCQASVSSSEGRGSSSDECAELIGGIGEESVRRCRAPGTCSGGKSPILAQVGHGLGKVAPVESTTAPGEDRHRRRITRRGLPLPESASRRGVQPRKENQATVQRESTKTALNSYQCN